jgi:hypothetical protein
VRIEEAPGGGAAFRILFPRPERSELEDALSEALSSLSAPVAPSSSVS